MSHLLLAVACSVAVAAIFKVAELRGLDRMTVITANYAAAAAISAGLRGGVGLGDLPLGLVALAVVQGALFIAGYAWFAAAIRRAGVGLATAVMRLSVVVPVGASWAVWREPPTPLQILGLVLGGAAVILVSLPGRAAPPTAGPASPRRGRTLLLAALFVTAGAVDTINKAFDEHFAEGASKADFLFVVFLVALGLGLPIAIRNARDRSRPPAGRSITTGLLLGTVNYGSAHFLLAAVADLSGPVVFPANGIAVLLGAALLGAIVWGERPSRPAQLGLAAAVAALACLAG
ncbi:MAG: hypothetical protein D6705_18755 [Deltaproteobacteria bacterium]|nr:MAG: hypothetical protein D6705_18755 [Deltaproteobacteria bacterium]